MTPIEYRAAAIERAEKALTEMGESVANVRTLIEEYGDAVLETALLRAAWQIDGCPAHAVGSRGQLSVHPLVIAIREHRDHADKLARSLNLTPESRSRRRVGAPMGSSTAADRRGPARLRKAA